MLRCSVLAQPLSTSAVSLGKSAVLSAHLLQHVEPPYDNLGFADRDDMLVVQALEADGDPLPGRADHVGEVRMRESRADQHAVRSLHAVEIDEMQEEVSEPLGDRAGAKHLGQRRIALALEGEALDQADRQIWNLDHQLAQLPARQMNDAAIAAGNAGPLMHALTEHFRAANKVAGMPIGQRDLA